MKSLVMGKKIGEGAFGIVYCAQTQQTTDVKEIKNQIVAVKVLKGRFIAFFHSFVINCFFFFELENANVLDLFDRSSNSYTKSSLGQVKELLTSRRTNVKAEDYAKVLRNNLAKTAQAIVNRMGDNKYVSVHLKSNYIEFRLQFAIKAL